jgi:hypothetical protein
MGIPLGNEWGSGRAAGSPGNDEDCRIIRVTQQALVPG